MFWNEAEYRLQYEHPHNLCPVIKERPKQEILLRVISEEQKFKKRAIERTDSSDAH